MQIKAKTLHFIYAKKLKIVQIQEKSLWCILNVIGLLLFNDALMFSHLFAII